MAAGKRPSIFSIEATAFSAHAQGLRGSSFYSHIDYFSPSARKMKMGCWDLILQRPPPRATWTLLYASQLTLFGVLLTAFTFNTLCAQVKARGQQSGSKLHFHMDFGMGPLPNTIMAAWRKGRRKWVHSTVAGRLASARREYTSGRWKIYHALALFDALTESTHRT